MTEMDENLRRLLTVPEVAEMLRVSPKTLYVWVERGDFPSLRVGGRIRFDPLGVRRWLEAKARKEA